MTEVGFESKSLKGAHIMSKFQRLKASRLTHGLNICFNFYRFTVSDDLVDDTPHRIHRDCEPDATMGVTQQRQRDSHPMGAGEDEA